MSRYTPFLLKQYVVFLLHHSVINLHSTYNLPFTLQPILFVSLFAPDPLLLRHG